LYQETKVDLNVYKQRGPCTFFSVYISSVFHKLYTMNLNCFSHKIIAAKTYI